MFTPEERGSIRDSLLEMAARDRRISGAAITGSAAGGVEDKWSDIDLAFGIADASEISATMADWTTHMYRAHSAVHHFDVKSGQWIYRVFLLPSTLQVDLAFVSESDFRALTPTFRLVHGKSEEEQHVPSPAFEVMLGYGWLYALHARSSIVRHRFWKAEYMISGIRDNALTLACIRHGVTTAHGKGFDKLPKELTDPFKSALVLSLDAAELLRTFRVAVDLYLIEIKAFDADLAERIRPTLWKMVETAE